MSDEQLRISTITLTALAGLAVLVDAPAILRVPVVLMFVLLAPGVALVGQLPKLTLAEKIAIAGSFSLSVTAIVSLILVSLHIWNGGATLVAIFMIVLLVSLPKRSSRRDGDDLSLDWHAPDDKGLSPEPISAKVLSINVSGALVVVPRVHMLGVGVRIPVMLDGEQILAEIRAVALSSTGEHAFCGIEFVSMTQTLSAKIASLVEAPVVADDRREPVTRRPG